MVENKNNEPNNNFAIDCGTFKNEHEDGINEEKTDKKNGEQINNERPLFDDEERFLLRFLADNNSQSKAIDDELCANNAFITEHELRRVQWAAAIVRKI